MSCSSKKKTVADYTSAEIVEKKSRFIAQVKHVGTEEAALQFISDVKKKHSQARHNVYAYIIAGKKSVDDAGKMLRSAERIRFSDDGEPSQTAGKPTLSALQSQDLANVACVVTRYFGGVLLGTGGLTRAYFGAVKSAIEAAHESGDIIDIVDYKRQVVTCDYHNFESKKREIEALGGVIDIIDYGQNVTIEARLPIDG